MSSITLTPAQKLIAYAALNHPTLWRESGNNYHDLMYEVVLDSIVSMYCHRISSMYSHTRQYSGLDPIYLVSKMRDVHGGMTHNCHVRICDRYMFLDRYRSMVRSVSNRKGRKMGWYDMLKSALQYACKKELWRVIQFGSHSPMVLDTIEQTIDGYSKGVIYPDGYFDIWTADVHAAAMEQIASQRKELYALAYELYGEPTKAW